MPEDRRVILRKAAAADALSAAAATLAKSLRARAFEVPEEHTPSQPSGSEGTGAAQGRKKQKVR